MSAASPRPRAASTRLVLFEVAGATYAIPIAEVLEVMETAPTAGIPGLPRRLAGVVNHHGDALPVVSREAAARAASAVLRAMVREAHKSGSPLGDAWQTVAFAVANPLFLKSIPQGAATQTWAAVHPGAAAHAGAYLADCNVATSTAAGQDLAMAARLWEVSEQIVAKLA